MDLVSMVAGVTLSHYQILSNDVDKLVIKINPRAYEVSLQRNYKPKSFISFNSNYYWNSTPIGRFIDGDNVFPSINPPFYRPEFNINQCTITGGPTLVEYSKIVNKNDTEMFRADIFRKTRHVAVGITAFNKLIVGYYERHTPQEIAVDMLGRGVVYSIKLDGGQSSFLKVGDLKRGNTLYITCAVRFEKK